MGISFSQRNDYYACIAQLEKDIAYINDVTNKDSLNMVDEIKLMHMSTRMKKNLETAKGLIASAKDIDPHTYYYTCTLVNYTTTVIERFNAKHI